jgi:hypothetical protein
MLTGEPLQRPQTVVLHAFKWTYKPRGKHNAHPAIRISNRASNIRRGHLLSDSATGASCAHVWE